MRYEIGSPATPALVVVDEAAMVPIVLDTVAAGRRVVIGDRDHPGLVVVERVMDGLVVGFVVHNREQRTIRWPTWAHRVRRLLTETEQADSEKENKHE